MNLSELRIKITMDGFRVDGCITSHGACGCHARGLGLYVKGEFISLADDLIAYIGHKGSFT